jgi:carbonic anhydrase/acetyltransferase-like protein (isoleucine patch superfamily)
MSRFGPLVQIDPSAWVHESALLYGKITLGPDCSVWPYAVVRSELHEVILGQGSNLQDFAMVHVGIDTPTIIGRTCSIAHHATVHGATLGDNVLIGVNATVMDGAVIGANSIVAGQSMVREGSVFPENSIIAGVPARVVATRDNREANIQNAEFYIRNARAYANGIHRMDHWDPPA